jgi:hypothetical protein
MTDPADDGLRMPIPPASMKIKKPKKKKKWLNSNSLFSYNSFNNYTQYLELWIIDSYIISYNYLIY